MIRFQRNVPVERADELLKIYHQNWWSTDRTKNDIKTLLKGPSITLGGYIEEDLVAFVRVIHDGVYKAVIFDVMVDRAYHDMGYGKRLMNEILAFDEIKYIKHIELYCLPEMMSFYGQWGFVTQNPETEYLRLKR